MIWLSLHMISFLMSAHQVIKYNTK